MIICIACLLISLIACGSVLYSYLILKYGTNADAEVISVDYTVATGLRSFLTLASRKKENESTDIGCDYILKLSYQDAAGNSHEPSVSVSAIMKIREGKRTPYFKEGDTVRIRYWEKLPAFVCIDDPLIYLKQNFLPKLFLWIFCAGLCVGILIFLLDL